MKGYRTSVTRSIHHSCGMQGWIKAVLILIGLMALAWWALQDPIIPDASDCRALGHSEDCWKNLE